MKAHFNLIQIDVNYFFTVRTDLGNLAIKVNRVATAGAARNNDADYPRFLLHGKLSFQKMA